MKVAVIGLGSMGKRRIRLIRKYNRQLEVIGIDLNEERCNSVQSEYGIETYTDLDYVLSCHTIDCAVITSAPLTHAALVHKCLLNGLHVFTELNLTADMYEENMALAEKKGKVLFMSSTFLYRSEVEYINEAVKEAEQKLRYRYHVGQYLPDWHPWESYKNFFVANTRTNGCREIFAIELPWLTKVFGKIVNVNVQKGKISDLDVDYNDYYNVYIEHESGHAGSLQVDVVSRTARRDLEIIGENTYIRWDGKPDGLSVLDMKEKEWKNIQLYEEVDKLSGYSANIIENAYCSEIETFFETIAGNAVSRYSYKEDAEILSIIDNIENE